MALKDPIGTVQVQRQHRFLILGLTLAVFLPVLAACGGGYEYGHGPGSSASPSSSATSDPYREFDQDVARLLDRQAVWQAPKRINVDSTARVGLVVGDPRLLKTEISQLVPGSYPKPAGPVKVGSTISVQLVADPNDAIVTPSDAIDKSIGERTALLWTWYVRATHPNASPGLFLTAEITTKMSDGHVLQKELALNIPVDRTAQYTMYQIFTNWATWVAIFGAASGLLTWIWKRRKKAITRKAYSESDEGF